MDYTGCVIQAFGLCFGSQGYNGKSDASYLFLELRILVQKVLSQMKLDGIFLAFHYLFVQIKNAENRVGM